MVEKIKPDMPRRARARAMGEVMTIAERLKDDKALADRVREIVARVRMEEAAWKASLDEHGAPLKVL